MLLPPVTDARARGMHAHCFSVRDLLGDHRPEIHHAAFLDSRDDVHYVALIEGLPIVLVHRIKGNWPGGYRLYATGRNEGGTFEMVCDR
jgi:hypothetical protein